MLTCRSKKGNLRRFIERFVRQKRGSEIELTETHSWKGLPRYRESFTEDADSFVRWQQLNEDRYIKHPCILKSSSLSFTYFYDVVGTVPPSWDRGKTSGEIDIGNEEFNPEYGLNLSMSGARIYYGPWADRHRSCFQDFFLPPSYRNNKVTPFLKSGMDRLYTEFNLTVEFTDPVRFTVPTREASKDWMFTTEFFNTMESDANETRNFGFVELSAGSSSRIYVHIPMIVGTKGYTNVIEVECKGVETITSVDHSNFLSAADFSVRLLF